MATSGGLLATCGVPPLAAPQARLARLRLIAFSQASSKRCGLLQGRTAHALSIRGVSSVCLVCSARLNRFGNRQFMTQLLRPDPKKITLLLDRGEAHSQTAQPLSPNSGTPMPRTGQCHGSSRLLLFAIRPEASIKLSTQPTGSI